MALRITRVFLGGSFLFSIALAFLLTLRETGYALALAVFAIGALLLLALLNRLGRRQASTDWLLAVAVLNLALVVPELSFRAAGFRYESGIQFGYPRPTDFLRYEPHPDLFWTLPPSRAGVNSLGFPGGEVERPKPDGNYRILFLGDSVTQQGYPDYVEALLNAGSGVQDGKAEAVTLAVYGYSSYQGRVLANMYAEPLEPDLAVVFFGWNDHWLAYGSVDSGKKMPASGSSSRGLGAAAYRNLRILQAMNKLRVLLTGGEARPIGKTRVPIQEYRENLEAIHEAFDRRGVPVLFLTGPTSHGALGVPEHLVRMSFATDQESVLRLHHEYGQVAREVAAERGALLLDLEAEFNRMPEEEIKPLFWQDGIHLTNVGLAVMARRIAEVLEERVFPSLLDAPEQ